LDDLLNGFLEVPMPGLEWLAAVAVILILAGLFAVVMNQRRIMNNTVRKVRRQFNGTAVSAIADNAYFCGMGRNWDNEWRGRGVLMLTDEMLYFRLCGRPLDLNIRMDRVQAAELDSIKKYFLQSRQGLKVVYRGVGGNLRYATWLVKNPQDWVALIERHITEAAGDGTQA
jgi:hypothetical protein